MFYFARFSRTRSLETNKTNKRLTVTNLPTPSHSLPRHGGAQSSLYPRLIIHADPSIQS